MLIRLGKRWYFHKFYLGNERVVILQLGKLQAQRVGRDTYGRLNLPFCMRVL